MKRLAARWAPAAMLLLGSVVTVGLDRQRAMPLRAPLAETVPDTVAGFRGRDHPISDDEIRVAGMTDYLFRVFHPAVTGPPDDESPESPWALSLYVGFYAEQSRGRTIHSPRNCLPGAGWESLAFTTREIEVGGGTVTVNQHLIMRESEQAVVLYWYQGRGRIEANEYRVKLDLLRDAALRGRSDEALVRLVVPVVSTEEEAARLAEEAARRIIPAVRRALPSARAA